MLYIANNNWFLIVEIEQHLKLYVFFIVVLLYVVLLFVVNKVMHHCSHCTNNNTHVTIVRYFHFQHFFIMRERVGGGRGDGVVLVIMTFTWDIF